MSKDICNNNLLSKEIYLILEYHLGCILQEI